MAANSIVTAKTIDFNAAREARKARELSNQQPSIRRDVDRRAARSAL